MIIRGPGIRAGAEQTGSGTQTFVAAIDPSAHFIYSSNRSLQGALVSSALPAFLPIAEAVVGNKSGVSRFQDSGGQDYVTAFAPLPHWTVGLAVGHDRSPFGAARTAGEFSGLCSPYLRIHCGVVTQLHHAKEIHGMGRSKRACRDRQGNLDRPIELKSSDDARAIADSINAMAEKMRAQIARERRRASFSRSSD